MSIAALGSFASAEPSNKWRIVFNHSTDAAGEMVFRITPLNGTPIDVTTQIPKGTGENQAAQLVKKSLKATLGKGYKVEVDDFETVLIKKAGKTPNFDLDAREFDGQRPDHRPEARVAPVSGATARTRSVSDAQ